MRLTSQMSTACFFSINQPEISKNHIYLIFRKNFSLSNIEESSIPPFKLYDSANRYLAAIIISNHFSLQIAYFLLCCNHFYIFLY